MVGSAYTPPYALLMAFRFSIRGDDARKLKHNPPLLVLTSLCFHSSGTLQYIPFQIQIQLLSVRGKTHQMERLFPQKSGVTPTLVQ